jgi:hypothetical protein
MQQLPPFSTVLLGRCRGFLLTAGDPTTYLLLRPRSMCAAVETWSVIRRASFWIDSLHPDWIHVAVVLVASQALLVVNTTCQVIQSIAVPVARWSPSPQTSTPGSDHTTPIHVVCTIRAGSGHLICRRLHQVTRSTQPPVASAPIRSFLFVVDPFSTSSGPA